MLRPLGQFASFRRRIIAPALVMQAQIVMQGADLPTPMQGADLPTPPEGLSKSALKKWHKKQQALEKKAAKKKAGQEAKGFVQGPAKHRRIADPNSSPNVLEHLPALLHLLVSSCTGVEHVVAEETTECLTDLDFCDLFQACVRGGFYELEDSKAWSFGSGIFTGKYAFSLPTPSIECDSDSDRNLVRATLQTVSSLKSAEHVSVIISFVPGGLNDAFRADSAEFITSLETLEDGGPAGSLVMWQKAFWLWKQWRCSTGATDQEDPQVPRFRVTTQQTPKKYHPFSENRLGQALAKGLESRLGWKPDVENFELEVSCRLREQSVLVSVKLHQGGLRPSKQPLHLTYSLCASLGMSPAHAPPASIVAYSLGDCGTEAQELVSSSFPTCFVFMNDQPGGATSTSPSISSVSPVGPDQTVEAATSSSSPASSTAATSSSASSTAATSFPASSTASFSNIDRIRWDSRHLPFRTSALDKLCTAVIFPDQKPTEGFSEVAAVQHDAKQTHIHLKCTPLSPHRMTRSIDRKSRQCPHWHLTQLCPLLLQTITEIHRVLQKESAKKERRMESGQCVLMTNMKKVVTSEVGHRNWRIHRCDAVTGSVFSANGGDPVYGGKEGTWRTKGGTGEYY
jgi:hypothetical protein